MQASRLDAYPHEFSGGMRQRALIAMAIACRPRLLIADEPTTALDVTVQAQIVDLIAELRRDLGIAVIFISHNLQLVAEIVDRVVVMYGGKVVENGPVEAIEPRPRHPYTGLLAGLRAEPDRASRPAGGDRGRAAASRSHAAGLPVLAALPA